MNYQTNDKSFVFWTIVIGIVFIIVVLGLMWAGFGEFKDRGGNPTKPSLLIKIVFTIVFIVVIFLGILLFKHQRNKDEQQRYIGRKQINKQFSII
ncbi:MAG: hypothetical protein Q7S74_00495 [Nanoarchaeota archaeon]|nr:hypothetical protein [Nanoarchaeota archaeon]